MAPCNDQMPFRRIFLLLYRTGMAHCLLIQGRQLLATVERYNELYDKQNDEDFGKPAYRLSAIRTAPVYGCWLGASLLTTEQGIAINEKGQALDNNNQPMEGLYITGDMSGSFFANNYPCLMAGVAMGRTLTFAMKAVKQMAGLDNA